MLQPRVDGRNRTSVDKIAFDRKVTLEVLGQWASVSK